MTRTSPAKVSNRCALSRTFAFELIVGNLMAVPKRKMSKSKSRSRRASAWTLNTPARSLCPRCSSVKLPHVVCGNCGWYNGRVAIDVE